MSFSVNMCVYKNDTVELLGATFNSILRQSLLPQVLVLSQDGPISKALRALILEFQEIFLARNIEFNWLISETNKGHGHARNIALAATTTDYTVICDSDDLNHVDRFSVIIGKLNTGYDVFGSQIDEYNVKTGEYFGSRRVWKDDEMIKTDLKYRCPMNLTSVGFKTSVVKAVGGFGLIPSNEDYSLWIKLVRNNVRFGNTDLSLVDVSVNPAYFERRGGLHYFIAEYNVQRMLLNYSIIGPLLFMRNCMLRFIVQVLLPNVLRVFIFKKFARK